MHGWEKEWKSGRGEEEIPAANLRGGASVRGYRAGETRTRTTCAAKAPKRVVLFQVLKAATALSPEAGAAHRASPMSCKTTAPGFLQEISAVSVHLWRNGAVSVRLDRPSGTHAGFPQARLKH